MKAYIFDYREDRRTALSGALSNFKGMEVSLHGQVDLDLDIESNSIVFLHLGDFDGNKCGNVGSIGFYEKMLKNKNIPVIAYSGGTCDDCPSPPCFQETVNEEQWHIFLNNVNGPDSFNLEDFIRDFMAGSNGDVNPPNFDILPPKSKHPLHVLNILCFGYLIAHGEVKEFDVENLALHSDANKRALTEKPDWWLTVLDKINIPKGLLGRDAKKKFDDFTKKVRKNKETGGQVSLGDVKALLDVLKER